MTLEQVRAEPLGVLEAAYEALQRRDLRQRLGAMDDMSAQLSAMLGGAEAGRALASYRRALASAAGEPSADGYTEEAPADKGVRL